MAQVFEYADATDIGLFDSGTDVQFLLAPSFVSYPPRFDNQPHPVKGEGVVVQHALKDSRVREWIWEGHNPNSPNYDTFYLNLLNLHHNLRTGAGKSQWVFLKEDVSGNFVNLTWNGSAFDETSEWVRVKVVDVAREISIVNSQIRYRTILAFTIDDANWNNF